MPDPSVLELSAREGRVLLTDDVKTMEGHFNDFLAAGNEHPGLILGVKRRQLREYLRDLRYTLDTVRPEDLHNNCVWLRKAETPAGG